METRGHRWAQLSALTMVILQDCQIGRNPQCGAVEVDGVNGRRDNEQIGRTSLFFWTSWISRLILPRAILALAIPFYWEVAKVVGLERSKQLRGVGVESGWGSTGRQGIRCPVSHDIDMTTDSSHSRSSRSGTNEPASERTTSSTAAAAAQASSKQNRYWLKEIRR